MQTDSEKQDRQSERRAFFEHLKSKFLEHQRFQESTKSFDHEDELSRDFAKLWKSKEFSDVEFQCLDGEIIKAHKSILSARSPKFREMLTKNLTENTIKVDNISKDILEKLLEYLYTGHLKIERGLEGMSAILHASDLYQMERLKLDVWMELWHLLTVWTAGEIVVLAHKYNAPGDFKDTLQKFLLNDQNRIEISKNESFQQLLKKHPVAFSEITFGVFLCDGRGYKRRKTLHPVPMPIKQCYGMPDILEQY